MSEPVPGAQLPVQAAQLEVLDQVRAGAAVLPPVERVRDARPMFKEPEEVVEHRAGVQQRQPAVPAGLRAGDRQGTGVG